MKFIKKNCGIKIDRSLFRKKIVKDYSALVGSNFALKPIQFIKGLLVAKFLGPSDYGILKSVELIQMLDKFGSLGFNTTAAREIGNALGANNQKKVETIRNTAYSSESLLILVLFFIGLSSTIFFDSVMLSVLIIMASTGMLVSKFRAIFATEAVIQKKFILTSKIIFFTNLIAAILVIILVPYLKIYAVLLTNIISGLLSIIFYFKSLTFNYQFKINKDEFKKILGISIPLTFNTLAFGTFRYAERILIIRYLSMDALGFFAFASMAVGHFTILFSTSVKVRMQDIFEGIGKGDYTRVHKIVLRETTLFTIISLLLIPLLWLSIEIFTPLLLPKWIDGIYSAQLYLFMLPLEVIPNYVSIVLISSLVNKQKILPLYRLISTGLLICFTIILYYWGILTLEKFIIIYICSSAFYKITVIVLYKKHFYNIYVQQ
ncbi:MAG: oligosaccharide flippase family protein [Ignavibacteria bacterium]